MSFLSSILNFFGTKSKRDMKELSPIVDRVLSHSSNISDLSNDELRQKTNQFRKDIQEIIKNFDDKINTLKTQAGEEINRDKQENLYKEIDELNSSKHESINQKLDSIKEESFAIIKETAYRFNNEDNIAVNATELDIKLSENINYVKINGAEAIWNTSWESGGVVKKWDMVHYDVQLIGGLVLHQGKIAEMQTGEGKTLVATLPIYLNALTGLGVHVVTVNDYLAKRDSEWMGPLFE